MWICWHHYFRYIAPSVILGYLYIHTARDLRPPEGELSVMMYEQRADITAHQHQRWVTQFFHVVERLFSERREYVVVDGFPSHAHQTIYLTWWAYSFIFSLSSIWRCLKIHPNSSIFVHETHASVEFDATKAATSNQTYRFCVTSKSVSLVSTVQRTMSANFDGYYMWMFHIRT